ncbi:MAG: hypothetical protein D6808_00195 [Candidatus Dadabacteria bacterium]|nr:MAG: hypothetical protein D6808_00195 [Candidatus Dadabacteria bacterium]
MRKLCQHIKLFLIPAMLSLIPIAHGASAQDNVEALKKKVETLKENVEQGELSDDAFALEDEEFEKLRKQLLEEERRILGKSQKNDNAKSEPASGTHQQREVAKRDSHTTEPIEKEDLQRTPVATSESLAQGDNSELLNQISQLEAENQTLSEALKEKEETIHSLKAENASLKKALKIARSKSASLRKELERAKSRLMVAQTKIERLSHMMDVEYRRARFSGKRDNTKLFKATKRRTVASSPSEDLPIVTVTAKKAYLRAGPGKNNSPLMTVKKGTRLAVETRKGEWYRVTTPTGSRAWISSEVVAFGADERSSPSTMIKIKGYDSDAEDKAFNLIRSRATN